MAPHLNPGQAETRGPSRLKGKGYDLGGRPGPASVVDEALPVTEHPIDEDPSMVLTCPESR